jgi:hypothetical protein
MIKKKSLIFGWKRWGFVFLLLHIALFLISILVPTIIGFFIREESPLLFLIYILPFYFDFPVSFFLSGIITVSTPTGEYFYLAVLFVVGSIFWFLMGSLLGWILKKIKG